MRRTVGVYATIGLIWVHAIVPTVPSWRGSGLAFAAPPAKTPFDPPRKIPTRPSAPPKLGLEPKIPAYACKRQILVGGVSIPCDSFTQRDGERLRPYLTEVPESLASLELYQRNRRSILWLPYVGSAALLVAAAGILTDRFGEITNSSNQRLISVEDGRIIRNVTMGIGAIVLVSTFSYGFFTLTLNERNFDNAVKKYNQAKPNAPIEIKVEGTMFFDVR